MIDDIELSAVQVIRQETDQDYVRQKIAGLEGSLHQKLGRGSHRVLLTGVLLPETAEDDLSTLQEKAASGEEVTFTADIATALSVEKMVIESLAVEQSVGRAGQYAYSLVLAESPPLPPPAEVGAFGGLEGFGLGDLGFDPGALGDVLSDIQDQAGAMMDTLDSALDALDQLQALASLADLAELGSPLAPLVNKISELGELGSVFEGLSGAVGALTSRE